MIRTAALSAALCLAAACGGEAQPQGASSPMQAPPNDPVFAPLIDLYSHLHSNPELSFQESATSAVLAEELEALNFEVTTGLGDDWVRAKAS
jgi:hypothetical protein